MVSDIKIIHGNNGMFISMPSKKRRNGTFRDIAHPLNNETRQMIEKKILGRYEEMMRESAQEEAAPGERERLEEEPPLTESTRDILGP